MTETIIPDPVTVAPDRLLAFAREILAEAGKWEEMAAACDRRVDLPVTSKGNAGLLVFRAQALADCAETVRDIASTYLVGPVPS
jgi:hypothetical protein